VSGNKEGVVHNEGYFSRASDLIAPFRTRRGEGHGRCLLEGVQGSVGSGLSTQNNHGHSIADSILEGRDQVGDAGTGGGNDYPGRLPAVRGTRRGGLGVPFRNMPCRVLVGVRDPPDRRGIHVGVARVFLVELVQQGQHRATRVSVHQRNAVLHEFAVDHRRAALPLVV